MALIAKPTRTNRPPQSVSPDNRLEIVSPPAPAPKIPELVFEDDKLPSAKDAANDYVARQNERLRRRREKQNR